MDIKKALRLVYEKEKGELEPISGIEIDNLFILTVVTAKGRELIGNNAFYLVTKDGKICSWVKDIPEEYLYGDFVRSIEGPEIKKIWKEFA